VSTVLVTGGAGYIGSHTCKALAQAGFRPVAYDSLCRGHAEAVRWGALEIGTLLDTQRLKDVIGRHRPVGVIHFAAHAYVGESVLHPGMYYETNVAGTLRLLQAMLETRVSTIVFSSSCAIYGIPESVPIAEEATLCPVNPYGASKLIAERIVSDFGLAHGFRWIALRYVNAAGASPDGEIGEWHDPEPHLIPRA
jgi:UDP-arabinose 4-epimerase